MPDIVSWMEKFKQRWKNKEVDEVLKLFTEDVVYYETPTQRLEDKGEIRKEWQAIKEQENIKLDYNIFSNDQNKYTVKWKLEYKQNSQRQVMNGIYLVKLNSDGKCYEFWQYCQNE